MSLASKTQLGIAPPRPGSAPAPTRAKTPSGRYRLIAPEAPAGSILRVTTREGSTRFVRKHSDSLFLDVDLCTVDFADWDFASRAETEAFALERRLNECADATELHGAPSFAATIRCLPRRERDDLLCYVADVLRERGKPGKASAVLAYRFEEDY